MAHEQINIDHIAELCRIELTPEEKQIFKGQIDTMLTYLEQLGEVDISKVDATIHPTGGKNILRSDNPQPSFSVNEALMNAPEVKDEQIVVPKIVE